MYQEFFGLRELPFELTSNPRFLFLTTQHREALSNLQHGVQMRKGLTLLVGAPGTGKSTLLRALMKGITHAGAYYFHTNNPRLTRSEFVEMMASGFHLSDKATGSKAALVQEMEQSLKQRVEEGRLTALVVDEAQSLSDELLEEIRLLANIETDSVKLLPVVLAGQTQLAERMNEPALLQLKQRVSLRCDLRPLDFDQTVTYIAHRINTAGGKCSRVFTQEAVRLIQERSGGIPRVINTLCDNALTTGFALDRRPVTRAIALEVCNDFDLPAGAHDAAPPPVPVAAPAAPALDLGAGSVIFSNSQQPKTARARRFGIF